MRKTEWAYDFVCAQPIRSILAAFNAAEPWQWELRESGVYGDYLNCRPAQGVRVRIHEYPQTGEYGTFVGLRGEGYSALLEIDADAAATRVEIDDVFQRLLNRIGATDTVEIEPYD